MPPLKPPRIYWDSCVFLSYFGNEYPERRVNIQALLDEVEASKGSFKIITSVLAKVEVAYIAEEKTAPEEYPNMEAEFDKLWSNIHLVELAEVHDDIVMQARTLTRTAFLKGWRRLRANDAIHLATAMWMTKHVEMIAFHTYNTRDYEQLKEIVPFRIEEPRPAQFQLFPC